MGQCSRMSHEAVPSEPSQQHGCFQSLARLKLEEGEREENRYNLNV